MHIPTLNPKKLVMLAVLAIAVSAAAQDRKPTTPVVPANGNAPSAAPAFPGLSKQGPKPYKEIITDKAVTKKGLFTIHKVEGRSQPWRPRRCGIPAPGSHRPRT